MKACISPTGTLHLNGDGLHFDIERHHPAYPELAAAYLQAGGDLAEPPEAAPESDGEQLAKATAARWNEREANGDEIPPDELEADAKTLEGLGWCVEYRGMDGWAARPCAGEPGGVYSAGKVLRLSQWVEPGAIKLSGLFDEQHPHKPKGEGGGQFAKKEETAEPETPAPAAAPKHGERATSLAAKHAELKAAMEAHKQERHAAFNDLKDAAQAASEKADEHFEVIRQSSYQIAWNSDNENEQSFTDLEEAIHDYDEGGTPGEQNEQLKKIEATAKECQVVKQQMESEPGKEDGVNAQNVVANQKHFQEIIANAIAAREQLRAYVKHRKEMRAIKNGEAISLDDGAPISLSGLFDPDLHPHAPKGKHGGQFIRVHEQGQLFGPAAKPQAEPDMPRDAEAELPVAHEVNTMNKPSDTGNVATALTTTAPVSEGTMTATQQSTALTPSKPSSELTDDELRALLAELSGKPGVMGVRDTIKSYFNGVRTREQVDQAIASYHAGGFALSQATVSAAVREQALADLRAEMERLYPLSEFGR
jgi:hypothetical protein